MATRYVNVISGNDSTGDGTYGNPYLTVQKAATLSSGGDIIAIGKSGANTQISGTWNWSDNSSTVVVSGDVTGQIAAHDYIGSEARGWWEVSSRTYSAPDTTIILVYKYFGLTGDQSTYKLTTLDAVPVSEWAAFQTIGPTQSGTSPSARISIIGGYNLTNGTRDGETYIKLFDGANPTNYFGKGLFVDQCSHIEIDHLHFCHGSGAIGINGYEHEDIKIGTMRGMGCGFSIDDTSGVTIDNLLIYGNVNGNVVQACNIASCNFVTINSLDIFSSGSIGLNAFMTSIDIKKRLKIYNSTGTKVQLSGGCVKARNFLYDGTFTPAYVRHRSPDKFYSFKNLATATDHRYWDEFGKIESQTSGGHTASGLCWKMSPTTYAGVSYPLSMGPLEISVSSGQSYVISVWVKKSDVSSSFEVVLRLPGGQLSGIDTDVTATATDSTDYQQVSLASVTPSEDGVLEVYVDVYGSSTANVLVDDLGVA